MRRQRELESEDARYLFDEAEDVRYTGSLEECWGAHREFMRIFGDEWWHLTEDATEPNPDYIYLERIIHAVQQALRQKQQQKTA